MKEITISGACNALEIALRDNSQGPVTVMLDSQAAITRLSHQEVGQGQHLALRAYETVLALGNQGREVTIQWVPGHQGIEGNERADQAAKQAASRPPRGNQGELSLAFTRRACTEGNRARRQQWLTKRLQQRAPEEQRTYKAQAGWKQDPTVAAAPKKIASRYYQLKIGHAVTGVFLHRIKARDSAACQGCQASRESVHHLLLECREWRRQ